MTDFHDYPITPGFTRTGTSEAAAQHMADKAPTIKARILAWFKDVPGRTATVDEIQDALLLTQISSRSRVTELGALGYLVRTGDTRALKSGLRGDVWRAA